MSWIKLIVPAILAVILLVSLVAGYVPAVSRRVYRDEQPIFYWGLIGLCAVLLAWTAVFRR